MIDPSDSLEVSTANQGTSRERPIGLELKALVESLLFIAEGPVSITRLARTLGSPERDVEDAVGVLRDEYRTRGLRLQRVDGHVRLVTAPEATPYIEQFLGLSVEDGLSIAAMEALAIIAYQQPLTRAQIEAIRGVDCSGVLRTLVRKELITELGRLEQAGRPIIYGTTFEFLRYFGLESLSELPPLPENGSEERVHAD